MCIDWQPGKAKLGQALTVRYVPSPIWPTSNINGPLRPRWPMISSIICTNKMSASGILVRVCWLAFVCLKQVLHCHTSLCLFEAEQMQVRKRPTAGQMSMRSQWSLKNLTLMSHWCNRHKCKAWQNRPWGNLRRMVLQNGNICFTTGHRFPSISTVVVHQWAFMTSSRRCFQLLY